MVSKPRLWLRCGLALYRTIDLSLASILLALSFASALCCCVLRTACVVPVWRVCQGSVHMARALLEKPPLAKSAAVVQMAGALLAALFSCGPALLWLVSCLAQPHLAAG